MVLFGGDFNAHDLTWTIYTNRSNLAGITLRQWLDNGNFSLISDDEQHPTFQGKTRPDLFLAKVGHNSTFNLRVLPSKHGSDHNPIIITIDLNATQRRHFQKQLHQKAGPSWNFKRANWVDYNTRCATLANLDFSATDGNIEIVAAKVNAIILGAA